MRKTIQSLWNLKTMNIMIGLPLIIFFSQGSMNIREAMAFFKLVKIVKLGWWDCCSTLWIIIEQLHFSWFIIVICLDIILNILKYISREETEGCCPLKCLRKTIVWTKLTYSWKHCLDQVDPVLKISELYLVRSRVELSFALTGSKHSPAWPHKLHIPKACLLDQAN